MIPVWLVAPAAVTVLAWLIALATIQLGTMLPEPAYLSYTAMSGEQHQLILMDVGYGLTHSLTPQLERVSAPAWSPDGRLIAFEGPFAGGTSIYVMDAFGAGLRTVTAEHAGNQYLPVWFADSSGLYFRNVSNEDMQAFQVHLDGTALAPIYVINFDYLVPHRFDYQRSVVAGFEDGESGIFLVRLGGAPERLVSTDITFRDFPQWSPDDRQIALISWGTMTEVFVMNADGSNFRQVTNDGLFKSNLNWRP